MQLMEGGKEMRKCSVEEFARAKNDGAQVVDVREASEYESEHVEGSLHLPLSGLNEETASVLDRSKPVYVLCRFGGRATKAAELLSQKGFQDATVVEGGIQAWIDAGKPIVRGERHVWGLDRQVRGIAGFFVLLGVLLAWFSHPYFILLSAFVGAGLVYSAVTDTCGMAWALSRMPWNRTVCKKANESTSCCTLEPQEKA